VHLKKFRLIYVTPVAEYLEIISEYRNPSSLKLNTHTHTHTHIYTYTYMYM